MKQLKNKQINNFLLFLQQKRKHLSKILPASKGNLYFKDVTDRQTHKAYHFGSKWCINAVRVHN
jgi:hypothetical protein